MGPRTHPLGFFKSSHFIRVFNISKADPPHEISNFKGWVRQATTWDFNLGGLSGGGSDTPAPQGNVKLIFKNPTHTLKFETLKICVVAPTGGPQGHSSLHDCTGRGHIGWKRGEVVQCSSRTTLPLRKQVGWFRQDPA